MSIYPSPTPIYHFTHIENLPHLLNIGMLLCKNDLIQRKLTYTNSAYDSIQSHRQTYSVPVSPGGTIHDYVPFYFNSLSPMLYTIKCGNLQNIRIEDLVFLKSSAQFVESAGCDFVFTDGHGIMDLTEYYNHLSNLDQLPWNVINARYWSNFTDGRRLRQAEFLVFKKFNWSFVEWIGVYNSDILKKVGALVKSLSHQPTISIKREWYF